MDNRVMLSARVPEELAEMVRADNRSNQEVLEAALWREFGGKKKSALERRRDEIKRRLANLNSEINDRDREREELLKDLESVLQKLETVEEQQDTRTKQLFEKARQVPRDSSHPLIEDIAEELDMTPEQVIEEAYDG